MTSETSGMVKFCPVKNNEYRIPTFKDIYICICQGSFICLTSSAKLYNDHIVDDKNNQSIIPSIWAGNWGSVGFDL